jgi:hypothetical protein
MRARNREVFKKDKEVQTKNKHHLAKLSGLVKGILPREIALFLVLSYLISF